MAEPKVTVGEFKKREAELAESRNALKTQITALIEGHLAELREIGFDFVLAENGAASNGKERRCGQCNGVGHTKATCPQNKK